MNVPRTHRVLQFAAILLLFGIFCCRYLEDDHIFLHLAIGRHLATAFSHSGAFDAEPLSYVPAPWFDPLWGGEVLLYCFSSIAGEKSLWLLPAVIYAGILTVFLPGAGVIGSAACAAILAIGTYPFHRHTGIEYLACLCAFAMLWHLKQPECHRPRLVLIQLLWSNIHPSAVLGPITALLFFSGKRPKPFPWSLLFILAASHFVSPYHWHNIQGAAYWWKMSCPVTAWWPVFWGIIAAALWAAKKDRSAVSVLIFWAVIACLRPTWAIPTAMWSVCLLCAHFPRLHLSMARAGMAVLPLAVAALAVSGADQRWCGKWGASLPSPAAAAFLEGMEFPVRMFHAEERAGWLAWKTRHKIFLDDRPFTHSRRLRDELKNPPPPVLSRAVQDYKMNVAVLDHTRVERAALDWFRREWHLVYCDESTVIFVKNDDLTAGFISRHEIHDSPERTQWAVSGNRRERSRAYYLRARVWANMGFPQRALGDIREARYSSSDPSPFIELCLEIGTPDSVQEAAFWCDTVKDAKAVAYRTQIARSRAKYAELQGDLQQAAEYLREAWKKGAEPDILFSLIEIDLKSGTPQSLAEAELWCKKAPRDHPRLLLYRAEIADRCGNLPQAMEYLTALLQKFPDHREAREYQKELEEKAAQLSLEEVRKISAAGRHREALSMLEEIMAHSGESADAHLEMGKIHLGLGNYQSAVEHLEKVLAVSPKNIGARCQIALALARLGRWEAALREVFSFEKEQQDHFEVRTAQHTVLDIAIAELGKRTAEIPERPSLGLQLANLLARREKFAEGIDLLEKFRDEVPACNRGEYNMALGDLYFGGGKSEMNQGDKARGISWLEESIRLNPDSFDAHLLLGAIALKMGQWEKATGHFAALKRIAPQDERGQYGLALVELGQSVSAQARGDYEDALQKLGEYCQKTPDLEEKKRIESLIENLSKNRETLEQKQKKRTAARFFALAVKKMDRGEWDVAAQLLENAISTDADLSDARLYLHYARGMAAMEDRQWESAGRSFAEALALKADFAEARYQLGLSLLGLSKMGEAEEAFLAVLENRPDFYYAHLLLVHLYYRCGKYERARAHYRAAIKTTGYSPGAGQETVIVWAQIYASLSSLAITLKKTIAIFD